MITESHSHCQHNNALIVDYLRNIKSAIQLVQMQIHIVVSLLILTYSLASCTSDSTSGGTTIDLFGPHSSRQAMGSDHTELHALIQVNSGPAQNYYFTDAVSPASVSISGIRRNEENAISVKWFETLHEHTIELSEQSQSFFADGTTNIDAPHRYTQFDYDRDGTSNLVERSDRTCVWSATESCISQNQPDIPTDNALLNGDFSDGTRYWFSELPALSETSGEYCVNSPVTAIDRWDARIDYSPLSIFIESNSRFNLVFDVRAQTDSKVFVQISARVGDTYKSLMDSSVDAITTYDAKGLSFESAEESYNEVYVGFNFGNGTDNTYCFDNIRLLKETS